MAHARNPRLSGRQYTTVTLLSLISALNAYLVRSQKIDELFDIEHAQIFNLTFSLMNIWAMTPEIMYNAKRNAHIWNAVPQDSKEVRERKNLCISPGAGVLLFGGLVALGHFFLFFDGNTGMFKEKYKIEQKDIGKHLPAFFSSTILALAGAYQEYLHGSRELAESTTPARNRALFCNTSTEGEPNTCINEFMYDGMLNMFLLLVCFAEFGLFAFEIDAMLGKQGIFGFLKEYKNFISLISASLSLMTASMYLGHEGKMFLKIIKKWREGGRRAENALEVKDNDESISVLNTLYLVGCLLNATVHSLSRYEGLSRFFSKIPSPIVGAIAVITGVSRFATLYVEEKEDDAPQNERKLERKYTVQQRGQDVLYEAAFIGTTAIGLFLLSEKNDEYTMLLSGIAAGLVIRGPEWPLACYDAGRFIWSPSRVTALHLGIDLIGAPILGALGGEYLLSNGRHNVLGILTADQAERYESSIAIIITLIARHVFKKILFCPMIFSSLNRALDYCSRSSSGELIDPEDSAVAPLNPTHERKAPAPGPAIDRPMPRQESSCWGKFCSFFKRSDPLPERAIKQEEGVQFIVR